MPHPIGLQTQPVFNEPRSAPKEWTMDALRHHLQAAVKLELTTIPMYLSAMYSIIVPKDAKEDNPAKKAHTLIHGIVLEEMLHLAIAGNCLTAVGGQPRLYGHPFVPTYPSSLLYEEVPMDLFAAHKTQIERFIDVERPDDLPQDLGATSDDPASTKAAAQYKSIGDFYHNLMTGMKELDERIKKVSGMEQGIFDKSSSSRQWGPDDLSKPPFHDGIAIIDCLDTALKKLELIVVQGEGGPPSGSNAEQSHYEKFKTIKELNYDVYNLAPNPDTGNFKGRQEPTYPVMLALDAAYSYLLWTLEKIWEYPGPNQGITKKLKGNIFPLMSRVVTPLAQFLVTQRLQTFTGDRNAAPPFKLHTFQLNYSPKTELQDIVKAAIVAYPNEPTLKGIPDVLNGLCDLGDI
ncbi:hypothetical protein FRC11_006443 [Ceratobasidium sp. 423]|nr:hypothetical protein FRC11_006443 [Ceratobasidium sp. 423]